MGTQGFWNRGYWRNGATRLASMIRPRSFSTSTSIRSIRLGISGEGISGMRWKEEGRIRRNTDPLSRQLGANWGPYCSTKTQFLLTPKPFCAAMEEEGDFFYSSNHVDMYATSFVDEEFLSKGLTLENALEYFRCSPFYSDGDVIEIEDKDAVESCEFFKIVKYPKHTMKGDEDTPLAVYYVLRGTIYQCPDLYSLLKYRMVVCACSHSVVVQLRVVAEPELYGAQEVRVVLRFERTSYRIGSRARGGNEGGIVGVQ